MAAQEKLTVKSWTWWRNTFLAGLFVVVPVGITYWVLNLLYRLIAGFTEPLVRSFVSQYRGELVPEWLAVESGKGGYTIPGAALIFTLLLILFVGLLVANVGGKRLVAWVEKVIGRVPLVNVIYPVTKQVVDSLKTIGATNEDFSNKPVVYVKYPNLSGYLLGFQTGRFKDANGLEMMSVFVPTAPNPLTGFVFVFEASALLRSNLSMEEAWKLIVSAGLIAPAGAVPVPTAYKTTPAIPIPAPADTTRTE
ncbi:MAG: DUF502 domain-containing protein [Verrucomicrobiales bacterium]|jgi:uncharacterized membrane protein|nr:DUF502 domain-containing protein [Verrucomicrobiales bacterium]